MWFMSLFTSRGAVKGVRLFIECDFTLVQVTGEGDDKYLIATAEQPLCALHRNNWMDTKTLPVKYKSNMRISSDICFEHNVE